MHGRTILGLSTKYFISQVTERPMMVLSSAIALQPCYGSASGTCSAGCSPEHRRAGHEPWSRQGRTSKVPIGVVSASPMTDLACSKKPISCAKLEQLQLSGHFVTYNSEQFNTAEDTSDDHLLTLLGKFQQVLSVLPPIAARPPVQHLTFRR